jgi:hypothetical protein
MKLIISQQACGCAGLARGQAELAFRLLWLLLLLSPSAFLRSLVSIWTSELDFSGFPMENIGNGNQPLVQKLLIPSRNSILDGCTSRSSEIKNRRSGTQKITDQMWLFALVSLH